MKGSRRRLHHRIIMLQEQRRSSGLVNALRCRGVTTESLNGGISEHRFENRGMPYVGETNAKRGERGIILDVCLES